MGKIIAILEIKNVAEMTEEERKEIFDWLKREAKQIIKEEKNYDKRFKACYIA